MRRSIRRTAVPYKSPRLFTMVALLVCLVIMMNNLRSMRGPGPNAAKIISNLDKSIKLVGTNNLVNSNSPDNAGTQDGTPPAATTEQPTSPATPEESPSSEPVNENPVNQEPVKSEQMKPQETLLDPVSDPSQSELVEGSNLNDVPNLNLREDLVLQDWLGLVEDKTLAIQKFEMPAYWRIMNVVKKTPFSELLKVSDSKIRFGDLYNWPSKHRSKLVTFNVNIRKVTRYEADPNPAGVDELYEVWCSSDKTMSWLFVFVTPELPPGLDADTPASQHAKFAGYFFKIQGYHSGIAKPNDKPSLAPMLIGKFELAKAAPNLATKPASTLELIIGAVILVVGLTAILLRIFVFTAKKPKLSRATPKVNLDLFTDR